MPIRKIEDKVLIPLQVSKQVLTIGPQYKNHRGGVGAVIEIYSKYFEGFQFIKSHKPGSKLIRSLVFLQCVGQLFTRLIFDRKIKIIHIHGASYGSFYRKYICFIIAKYLFGKKVIYHIHGGEYHLFYLKNNKTVKKLIRNFINNVDTIICLSLKWKDFFENNFNPKKIVIVSNIIDYPTISGSEKKEKQLTFLFLGYITQRKGIFDLVKVLSINKKKYQGKIKIVIGGNGEVDKLKSLITQHNLSAMVEFVGWISNEEKSNWFQKSDIYILPSYVEGLPISILEAMSYGHPIVSTDVGGIAEIVKPNENGILIEPGNLNEIESALNFFIENSEIIEKYGHKSKQLAKKHLPNFVMPELLSIYNPLLYKNEQTIS